MAKAAGAKEGKAKGDSLEAIYQEIEKLCGGVKGKNSPRLTVPKPVAVPRGLWRQADRFDAGFGDSAKGFVGFYLMCLYVDSEMKKKLSPASLKLLKGKSCFQAGKLEEGLKEDIGAALDAGIRYYKEKGWV